MKKHLLYLYLFLLLTISANAQTVNDRSVPFHVSDSLTSFNANLRAGTIVFDEGANRAWKITAQAFGVDDLSVMPKILLFEGGTAGQNIYTSDGILISDRIIYADSNNLRFSDVDSLNIIAENIMLKGYGLTNIIGNSMKFQTFNNEFDFIGINDVLRFDLSLLDGLAPASPIIATWQNVGGTVAWVDDIVSIYNTDDIIGPSRVATLSDTLTFSDGLIRFIGSGSTSGTTNFLIQNSISTELFRIYDDGQVSSRYGYQINDFDFLTSRCNGDNGSLNYNVLIGRGQPTGIVTTGGGNNGLRNTTINQAGNSVTTGYQNTFIGFAAGNSVTTGNDNVAVGQNALLNLGTPGSESLNTAIGGASYSDLVGGFWHSGFGYNSGDNVTGGTNTISIGYNSGATTSGSYSHSIAIGREARFNGSNQFVVGASTGGSFVSNFFFGRGVQQTALDNNGIKFQASSISAGVTDSSNDYPFIIAGSQGTGTGYGGDIIFKTAPAGASGSTQNPLVTVLTVKALTGVINIANIPTTSLGLVSGDVYSNLGILTIVP